jgi:hypothetical protein
MNAPPNPGITGPDPLVGDKDRWLPEIQQELGAISVCRTRAHTFKTSFGSASKPVVLKCADRNHWAVKAQYAGQGVAADSALAEIAHSLGAPVPPCCRVEIKAELIAAEPKLQNVHGAGPVTAGVWHGSKWLDGINPDGTDRRDNTVRPIPTNADAYGRLALLFAWCGVGDRQFVYDDNPPHGVHVVDLGHALPGANGWTAVGLDAQVASAPLPADLMTQSGLDKARAQSVLTAIGDPVRTIARAVARPLDHWADPNGLTMEMRVSLAHYLSRQLDAVWQSVEAL